MLKYLFDYDNTILNCDSDFLWNKFIDNLSFLKKNNFNYLFYKIYNKKIINNYCYYFFSKKKYELIKKIKVIFNYIIKIFYNKNYYYKKKISTSTNFFLIYSKKKIFNKYLFLNNSIINCNYKKILNFNKIIKKKLLLTDSINDIYFFFFNKKNIIFNPDNYLYLLKNYILSNNVY